MTAIVPGTDGTLTSDTAEAQLIDILAWIRMAELTNNFNPDALTNVQIRFDGNARTCSGTFSMRATRTINGSGNIVLEVIPYLTQATFTPGTAGTFKSATPEGYLIEVAEYIQLIEGEQAASDLTKNRVISTFDSDRGLYSGSFSVPIVMTIDDGIKFTVTPYLT